MNTKANQANTHTQKRIKFTVQTSTKANEVNTHISK